MKNILFFLVLCCAFQACTFLNDFEGEYARIICHRGYWDTPNNVQNSLTSLKMAQGIPVYGSEFDVSMSCDGILVVCHNPLFDTLDVTTLAYEDIKKYNINGHNIPTLDEYLKQGKKGDIKLVLELKPVWTSMIDSLAVIKCVEAVKKFHLEDKVDFMSFSLFIAQLFSQLMPFNKVYYLGVDISPQMLFDIGINGIGYHFSILESHPEWVKEAHILGMYVNSWTVNDEVSINKMLNLGVDYLTTDNPLLAIQMTSFLSNRK